MFYTNYKNFDFPKNFKGFKISRNPTIKTFRVFENSRNIEYAPNFVQHLNGYQKYFIDLFLTKLYKLKDVGKATSPTRKGNSRKNCRKRNLAPSITSFDYFDSSTVCQFAFWLLR